MLWQFVAYKCHWATTALWPSCHAVTVCCIQVSLSYHCPVTKLSCCDSLLPTSVTELPLPCDQAVMPWQFVAYKCHWATTALWPSCHAVTVCCIQVSLSYHCPVTKLSCCDSLLQTSVTELPLPCDQAVMLWQFVAYKCHWATTALWPSCHAVTVCCLQVSLSYHCPVTKLSCCDSLLHTSVTELPLPCDQAVMLWQFVANKCHWATTALWPSCHAVTVCCIQVSLSYHCPVTKLSCCDSLLPTSVTELPLPCDQAVMLWQFVAYKCHWATTALWPSCHAVTVCCLQVSLSYHCPVTKLSCCDSLLHTSVTELPLPCDQAVMLWQFVAYKCNWATTALWPSCHAVTVCCIQVSLSYHCPVTKLSCCDSLLHTSVTELPLPCDQAVMLWQFVAYKCHWATTALWPSCHAVTVCCIQVSLSYHCPVTKLSCCDSLLHTSVTELPLPCDQAVMLWQFVAYKCHWATTALWPSCHAVTVCCKQVSLSYHCPVTKLSCCDSLLQTSVTELPLPCDQAVMLWQFVANKCHWATTALWPSCHAVTVCCIQVSLSYHCPVTKLSCCDSLLPTSVTELPLPCDQAVMLWQFVANKCHWATTALCPSCHAVTVCCKQVSLSYHCPVTKLSCCDSLLQTSVTELPLPCDQAVMLWQFVANKCHWATTALWPSCHAVTVCCLQVSLSYHCPVTKLSCCDSLLHTSVTELPLPCDQAVMLWQFVAYKCHWATTALWPSCHAVTVCCKQVSLSYHCPVTKLSCCDSLLQTSVTELPLPCDQAVMLWQFVAYKCHWATTALWPSCHAVTVCCLQVSLSYHCPVTKLSCCDSLLPTSVTELPLPCDQAVMLWQFVAYKCHWATTALWPSCHAVTVCCLQVSLSYHCPVTKLSCCDSLLHTSVTELPLPCDQAVMLWQFVAYKCHWATTALWPSCHAVTVCCIQVSLSYHCPVTKLSCCDSLLHTSVTELPLPCDQAVMLWQFVAYKCHWATTALWPSCHAVTVCCIQVSLSYHCPVTKLSCCGLMWFVTA